MRVLKYYDIGTDPYLYIQDVQWHSNTGAHYLIEFHINSALMLLIINTRFYSDA